MASSVTNYQCPNCGGPLHFDSTIQKLKCDYCDSEYTNEEIEKLFAEENQSKETVKPEFTKEEMGWSEEEASHLKAYSCPSCGAQLICEDTTAATSCPYCGNPTVIPSQFSGTLKPKYVIPFQLTKDDATTKLKEFYKGKRFLPKAFLNENHIEEIKGMYVPFWLYNATLDCDLSFHCTNTHVHSDGEYEITEIEHFAVDRKADVTFDKVPADAASKMPDEYMDAIEPFDYSTMVPFEMSYMPGYLADKFDMSAKDTEERALSRMENSAVSSVTSTVIGYQSIVPEGQDIRIKKQSYDYALLPVWVLATRYHDKPYLFVMNAQTGKMVGEMPMDKGKMLKEFLIVFLIATLIVFLILIGMA